MAVMISLCGAFLHFHDVHAMSLEQLKMLEGTALLELRTDEVIRHCGLPSVIVDNADVPQQRQVLHWGNAEMKLSSMEWEIVYSRQQGVADHSKGWTNPNPGSVTCLSGLTGLILHTKGDVGFLSVKKRTDNKGYSTSYDIPQNPYVAHQVIGLSGGWKQGVAISNIFERYGKPDEILERDGITLYRYWVVAKEKDMPVSLQAVDFEVKDGEKNCTQYIVQTNGFNFVQEKLDILLRQWESTYVD